MWRAPTAAKMKINFSRCSPCPPPPFRSRISPSAAAPSWSRSRAQPELAAPARGARLPARDRGALPAPRSARRPAGLRAARNAALPAPQRGPAHAGRAASRPLAAGTRGSVAARAPRAPRSALGLVGSPELGQDDALQRAHRAARARRQLPRRDRRAARGRRARRRRARARDRPARHLQPRRRSRPTRRWWRACSAARSPRCRRPTALVLTADACTLERSLLLVARGAAARAAGLPRAHHGRRAARARRPARPRARSSAALGVPVVGVVGHRGLGLGALKRLLAQPGALEPPAAAAARRAARARRLAGRSVLARVLVARAGPSRTTEAIDRVVLHPVGGTLLFARGDGALLPADLRLGRRPRWTRSTRASARRRRGAARERSRPASPPTSSSTAWSRASAR